MTPLARQDREGMILLNVLLILAVASVAVLVMITAQDIEVRRSTRLSEATQAGAYARAGELSAVTALRRDARDAPTTDNLTEPWAGLAQQTIPVPGGRFALQIEDEQARFNLNALHAGEPGSIALFQKIGQTAGVAPETQVRIANTVRIGGPLKDTGLLMTAGVTAEELARLEPWVAVLPPDATINLNTVRPALLALLTGDPVIADTLLRRRTAAGFLISADLMAAGQPAIEGTGFVSDHYLVATTVSVGDTTQRLVSRVARFRRLYGVDVVVTARQRTAG